MVFRSCVCVCVCARARACVRANVCVCVCVGGWVGVHYFFHHRHDHVPSNTLG